MRARRNFCGACCSRSRELVCMVDPFPLAPSLWAATAPPAVATPPLEGRVTADVVVIGAGYAGMSTALHLAERGTRVVVLEAHEPGWGGSGRHGGEGSARMRQCRTAL